MRPYTEINCLSWNDYFWKLVRRIASPGLQNMHVFQNIVPQKLPWKQVVMTTFYLKMTNLLTYIYVPSFINVPSTSLKIIRKIHFSINNGKMSLMHQSLPLLVALTSTNRQAIFKSAWL